MRFITTSWDDGYPKDDKLAELLLKYNLKGTFYIPQSNHENAVMNETNIVEIARFFEIGGHTLKHTRISAKSYQLFNFEILGCYNWLSDILSSNPISFCFPGGVFNADAVNFTKTAGFKYIRSTELLSIKIEETASVSPTTLQLYNHSAFTYLKHLAKRKRYNSIKHFIKLGCFKRPEKIAENYVRQVVLNGGCFHLWGHSWEIEKLGLWKQVEDLFKIISGISEVKYVTNGELATTK